jgi:PAS domain S-box-containing protein
LPDLQPLTAVLLDFVTPGDVAAVVVERGMAVLGARSGLAALVTDAGTELEIVRSSGYPPEVLDGWRRFPLNAPLPLSDAVRENRVLLFENRADWQARYPEMMEQVPTGNFQASVSLPLSARGRVFAALHFSFPTERSFSDADRTFFSEFANQCALALDRALLLERAEAAVVENTRLYEASRHAQRELERREHEYAAVVENADDVIARFDTDLRFLYANRAIERATGIAPEAFQGRTLSELGLPAENLRQWSAAIRKVFQTGEREMIEFAFPSPTLGMRWYEASITPELWEQKGSEDPGRDTQERSAPTTVIAVARDITERHRANEERERLLEEQQRLVAELEVANEQQQASLNASEERFRLLVEQVKDYAIFMLDPQGNIATWNAGAERFKGYRAEEIIGQHFSRFYTEKDIASRYPWYELEVAAREGRYEDEGWRVRKDGSRFWANVIITALRDEKGKLRGFAKVTRDFTERRAHEMERAAVRAAEQQRRFLTDVLASVTQGKLILCDSRDEMPISLAPEGDSISLTEQSLKTLRSRVAEVAANCGLSILRTQDLLTAVSEGAMNAIQHAGGGIARIYGDASRGMVQVWVEDHGKGIDLSSLPRATLERGFSTGGVGFGHGFWLMLQTCDRIYLLTGQQGTTVVMEQARTAPPPMWQTPTAPPSPNAPAE